MVILQPPLKLVVITFTVYLNELSVSGGHLYKTEEGIGDFTLMVNRTCETLTVIHRVISSFQSMS